ncbi:MAG: hypothetical protein R2734_08840 [Nocardioides sp.]
MDRPDAAPYQPRLRWWEHGWRLVAMLMLSMMGAATTAFTLSQTGGPPGLLVLDIVVGVLGFVLVHLRRHWPLAVAASLALAGCVSASTAGPGLLAAVSLATRRRWLHLIPVGLLAIASSEVYALLVPAADPGPWWIDLATGTVFTGAALGWGDVHRLAAQLVYAFPAARRRSAPRSGSC